MARVRRTIDTAYIFLFFASLATTALGLAFAGDMLEMLNTPAEIMPQALLFLRITFAGLIFLFGYNSLSAVLRGLGPLLWGADTKPLVLPIGDTPIELGPILVPPIQLLGAAVSLVFLAVFAWFFLKSRKGIAMRAVADNQQVAMAMGINVERYFALAWAMAGIVSTLGGVVWGSMIGVDVHLSLVGLKVFPVVILGGLESIPGAIVGGLIVGIVENVAAGYVDPWVGGGTKDFAPYVLMILALMIRPYGIFGQKIIERV